MGTQNNEKKTQAISIAIIATAAVIGISSIIASIIISNGRDKTAENNTAVEETADTAAEVFNPEEDSKEMENSEPGLTEETPVLESDGNTTLGEDENADEENPAEPAVTEEPEVVIVEEPEETPEEPEITVLPFGGDDTEEEAPEENSDDASSETVVKVREILVSCYASDTGFNILKLMKNKTGKNLYNDLNKFEQCIYASGSDEISDDCLYAYAKDKGIADVESAIGAYNLEFTENDSIGNGKAGMLININSDIGPGVAILSENRDSITFNFSRSNDGEDSAPGGIVIEIRNGDSAVENNTYMSVRIIK